MYKNLPFSRTTYYRRKKKALKLGCDIMDVPDNRGKHKNHVRGGNHYRKANIGDKHISVHGYVKIFIGREHYLADRNGHIYEHVWNWIKNGGIIPPKHVLHHVDGNTTNNDIKNLSLMSCSEHAKHHSKKRPRRNGRFIKIQPIPEDLMIQEFPDAD